jgi:hypothetical protein
MQKTESPSPEQIKSKILQQVAKEVIAAKGASGAVGHSKGDHLSGVFVKE